MDRYCERSIKEVCATNKEIIQKIYDHTMMLRENVPVSYRPLTVNSYVNIVHNPGIDFAEFFSEYQEGDYAYFACYMDGIYEREMLINVKGENICEIYFNGEVQELIPQENGSLDAKVLFRKGKNSMIVRVSAGKEGFCGYAKPILPDLRMFPEGYVYYTRQYIEADGYYRQSGITVSRLYRKQEVMPQPKESAIDWIFPVKPEQSNVKSFDFIELCGEKGKAAYVHTYVQGKIIIAHESPIKIFAAGKAVYCSEGGRFEGNYIESTPLLIKSGRGIASWGFRAAVEGNTALPFVEGADCPDLQWIWIGPFGREEDSIEYPYAPERNLQLADPYQSICAGLLYWKFYRPDTYLKQNTHSAFFGQWFYAVMVGHYGLKQAAEKLGIAEYWDYFMDSIGQMCRHRNYSVHDKSLTGWASYMPSAANLNNLDGIGTIGINVAEYYLMSGDVHAKYLLQLLADSLSYNIPRFEDGTFHRNLTMWTDDMYMCLPFMARLWVITGEVKYLDDIVVQVKGFYDRMFMEDQGLYSHIYFVKEDCPNRIPWGRGNGWVLLALSEVLLIMPKEYEGYATVLQIFRTFAKGVLRHRDKEKGYWHQVVNNPKSYMETSGSAMFITALARGVKHGWVEANCQDDIVEAWNALIESCIDTEGNVYGVCMGSGCHMDESYYLNLGTIVNDEHGVGIVLGAGAAVMDLLGEG